jgi:DNA-binding transcriptional ArsR family regulator
MLPDRRSLVVLLLAVLLCGYAPASGIAAAAVDGDDESVEDAVDESIEDAVDDSTDSIDAANVSLDQESDDWHDSADSGNGSSGTDATAGGTTDISLVDPTADATSSETTEWTDSDDDFPTVTEDIPEDPENATDGAENATDDVGDDVNDTTDDVDDTTDDVNDTTDDVNDTTDDVEEEVDDTTDDVDDTTDEVEDTTDDATNTTVSTDETIGDISDSATGTLDSTEVGVVQAIEESIDATVAIDGDSIDASVTVDDGAVDDTLTTVTDSDQSSDADGREESTDAAAPADETLVDGTTADESSGAGDSAASDSEGEDRGSGIPLPDEGTQSGIAISAVVIGAALLARNAGAAAALSAASASSGSLLATLVTVFQDWAARVLAVFGYKRYSDDDPLEHETREQLYEFIRDSPGAYLTEISEGTDVKMGTARYHLRILAFENLVTSEEIRGRRRYVPVGTEWAELEAALHDETTARIVESLAEKGPDSVSGLADRLDRDPSTITHHLDRLAEDGIVERERDGRAVVNKLSDSARIALEDEAPTPAAPRAPSSAD